MECHHNIINKTTITINTTTNTILVTRAIIRSLQKTRGLVTLFQLKIINLLVSTVTKQEIIFKHLIMLID